MGRVLHDPHRALHQRQDHEAAGRDPELPRVADQQHDGGRDEHEDLEVADEAREGGVRVPRGHRRDREADGRRPEDEDPQRGQRPYPAAQRLHGADEDEQQRSGVGRADLAGGGRVPGRERGQQEQHGRGERQQRPVPAQRARYVGPGPVAGGGEAHQLPPSRNRKKEAAVRARIHRSCHSDQVSM